MADLAELLERVKAATPETYRWIDGELSLMFDNPTYAFTNEPLVLTDAAMLARPYTSSLDAALALVERVLPGWRRNVKEYPEGWFAAVLMPDTQHWIAGYTTTQLAPTPALALLSALLFALNEGAGDVGSAYPEKGARDGR